MHSIHQFEVEALEGGSIDFADFRGKKILVVNVASECGFTPQYQQLQDLSESFKEAVVVVGFPSNNFGGQEPGSNAEIRRFCTERYQVTFPMAAKIDIHTHPVYAWLTQKSLNGVLDAQVSWNFFKFLLDEEGQLLAAYPSSVSPLDDLIMDYLSPA
ncbi:MAG: glutathione peroxidase [Phaeodactylibacter sp.]|nr:glutathione peroxidase [Phaeodactylibacter sp.]